MAIELVNIYTYESGKTPVTKECSVYNNGQMRLEIWAEVEFEDESESDVKKKVQKDLTISSALGHDLSHWTPCHGDSGPFDHNISNPQHIKEEKISINTLRVPVYFTIPEVRAQTESILATLDGNTISQQDAITLNIFDFTDLEASQFKFKIDNVGDDNDGAHLRKLYIVEPSNHHISHWEPKGVCFGDNGTGFTPIVSMIHTTKGHKAASFLLRTGNSSTIRKVASAPYYYYEDANKNKQGVTNTGEPRRPSEYGGDIIRYGETSFPRGNVATGESSAWEDSKYLHGDKVNKIFLDGGIPMIRTSHDHLQMFWNDNLFNTSDNKHTVTDNFGNKLTITIDWDAGDWWGDWEITNVKKATSL